MPLLTAVEQERLVRTSQVRMLNSQIARTFGCIRQTIIQHFRWVNQTGQTSHCPRSGRPRVMIFAEAWYLHILHLHNGFFAMTSAALTALSHYVIRNTVMRRHQTARIQVYWPFLGMDFTAQHCISHLCWVRRVRCWQRREWSWVIFTNENPFNLFQSDGRVRVHQQRGERLAAARVKESSSFGSSSIMVWGGICGDRKTELVFTCQRLRDQMYRYEVLQPVLVPFLQRQWQGLILQQENAKLHITRLTTDFLNRQNIQLLPWSSCSPDLSSIEHLWDHLGWQSQRHAHNLPKYHSWNGLCERSGSGSRMKSSNGWTFPWEGVSNANGSHTRSWDHLHGLHTWDCHRLYKRKILFYIYVPMDVNVNRKVPGWNKSLNQF